MAINYKTLGDRIKTKRISQGITQEKFAEHMDVSVGYISQLERGISKVSLERLVSISEYFNCNIDFFIDGINSNTEHYLAQDFEELYAQLSSHEKNILKILLQENVRRSTKSKLVLRLTFYFSRLFSRP